MRISSNLMGLNSHRNLTLALKNGIKVSERLASGLKINRAADDAAGAAISEKMRNQIAGLNKASKNVLDGISLIQTAEGGMSEIADILKRQRELTIQAMNDTNTQEDRQKMQQEINQLTAEITSTATKTEFNGIKVLSGNLNKARNLTETFIVTVAKGANTYNNKPFIFLKEGESFHVAIEDLTVIGGQNTTHAYFGSDNTGYGINSSSIGPFHGTVHYAESLVNHGAFYAVTYPNDSSNLLGGDGSSTFHNNTSDRFWWLSITNDDGGDPSQPAESTFKVTLSILSEADQLYIKSGANENQATYIDTYDCRAAALGTSVLSIGNQIYAEQTLTKIDSAIDTINSNRSNAGAQQNRLEYSKKYLDNAAVNLEDAKSRILDTDMAKEMMSYTKSSILQQAGTAMLTKSNYDSEKVLQILR